MKKSVGVVFIFLMLALVPTISAVNVLVKITTYPDHTLNVNFLPSTGPVSQLYVHNGNSGASGEVEFTFSTTKNEFDITAFVLDSEISPPKTVIYKRFEQVPALESIHLILFSGNVQIIENFKQNEAVNEINITETNETNITEEIIDAPIEEETEVVEENSGSPGITGAATSEDTSSGFPTQIIYYIGALLILSAAVFLGTKVKKFGGSSDGDKKEIKVKKMGDLKKDQRRKLDDYKKAVDDAEKKIGEAQKEIKKLKNVDKIQEIKSRMIEDQKELMKLRGDN